MENIKPTIKSLIARFHLSWVILYLFLIGGAVAIGAEKYEHHTEHILPSGSIELLVNKTKYQPGELVEFTVVNHFPTTIYVTNQCPGEPLNVYRWENKQWIQIHDTATDKDSECYSQERNVGIMPEGSRGYNFKDWPNLFKEPGVYRIAMVVQHSNDVYFQDFTVLEPAENIEVKTVAPTPKPAPQTTPTIQTTPTVKETPRYEDDDDRYEDEDEDEKDDD